MTTRNLPEEYLGQEGFDESEYFTEQDLIELKEFEEEKEKEAYLLKELILTDIDLLTI